MKQKGIFLIVLLTIIIFIISGCDLYNQLYKQQEPKEEGVTFIPIEKVKVEDNNLTEEPIDEADETRNVQPEDLFPPEEAKDTVKSQESIVVIALETERISLEPNASDPDNDNLQYFYTKPLNERGFWQTTYGDAGEYTVTITASDGILSASQEVLIIVNRKEEAPMIVEAMPAEKAISINENNTMKFSIKASDLNKDPLSYLWKLDGKEASKTSEFTYEIGFLDSGSHTVKVEVSDPKSATTMIWSITVVNVNRPPMMDAFSPITVKETETVTILPKASDPDGDEIRYKISDPVGDTGVWQTNYDDAGEYAISVEASDGTDTVAKDVLIKVVNVNRPPVITGIIRK